MEKTRVVAGIVTRNRPAELTRLLNRLLSQARQPDTIIVIDNGADHKAQYICKSFGVKCVSNQINIGGSGGFALACLLALSEGADYLWLWDDDGYPGDCNDLGKLLAFAAETNCDVVSPLVVSTENCLEAAFSFRLRGKAESRVSVLQSVRMIHGCSHLFNGALITRGALERFGLPDVRLFGFGDEVEFFWRYKKAGARIFTYTEVLAYHPPLRLQVLSLFSGRMVISYPADMNRRFIYFRNRTYTFWRNRSKILLLLDLIRYGGFFLLKAKGDFSEFRVWWEACLAGLREDFSVRLEEKSRSF